MRTDGGYGVPGMPGNGGVFLAGNTNPLQDPRFRIQNGSSNLRDAIGNMGGLQNAQFFAGPQLGQAPAGYQKYVSWITASIK